MKLKIVLGVVLAICVVLISGILISRAIMIIPNSDRAKQVSKAPQHSPVIDENWGLTRKDFIHYLRPAPAGKPKPQPQTCFKLLGASWPTLPVNYTINPTNSQNLTQDFIKTAIATGAETWDSATPKELFNNSYSINLQAKYGVQDFINTIAFGDYKDSNAIAITSVWYIPKKKQIIETDMLLNTKFSWGDATADTTKMDLQNIATHEFGHVSGLDDLYTNDCLEVTMYGYSSLGETKKRTLEPPDITGLNKVYP